MSISITRFGDQVKSGRNMQTIDVYCDSNDIFEALTGAFYEGIKEILKDGEQLPSFGRRESYRYRGEGIEEYLKDKSTNLEKVNASGNRQCLSHIRPFEYNSDPIEFLLKNEFRIEWDVFAREATDSEVAKIEERMPKGCQLHIDLKKVADKAIYPDGSPRGIAYDYLVKVIAGFSSAWMDEQ